MGGKEDAGTEGKEWNGWVGMGRIRMVRWRIYFRVWVKIKVFYQQNGKEMKEMVCITLFLTVDVLLNQDTQNALIGITQYRKKQQLNPFCLPHLCAPHSSLSFLPASPNPTFLDPPFPSSPLYIEHFFITIHQTLAFPLQIPHFS